MGVDYSRIAEYEHARWREIREYSSELDDHVVKTVEQQAKDIRAQLGEEKLQAIAAYRADRWETLAGTTRYEKNRDYCLEKSKAWLEHAGV